MPGLDSSTSITINGIQCWDEGVHEHYTRNGSSAEQTIVCKWADRISLVDFFLGGTELIANVPVTKPQVAYAPFPVLIADEVEVIEGIPGNTGLSMDPSGTVAYKYARLLVTYRSAALDVLNQNNDVYDVDYGKQIYTPSKDALKFADGKPLPVTKPIVIPVVSFTQTLRNLSKIPRDAIFASATAPLNSSPIFGAPAGTIMFDGARSKIRVLPGKGVNFGGVGSPIATSEGKLNADMTLAFIFNPRGHDKAMDIDGTWKVVKNQDGSDLYQKSDLNNLINAPTVFQPFG